MIACTLMVLPQMLLVQESLHKVMPRTKWVVGEVGRVEEEGRQGLR